ncbi:hypothetical protein K432DRAFT_412592, partial [Lepidopterella palustris CBS 459.81]
GFRPIPPPVCHNPREQQKAVQRFSYTSKKEKSLNAYLARLKRFAYKADTTSWPKVSRVIALHRGLRPSLRPGLRRSLKELNNSLLSPSYSKYVELVQSYNRRSRRPQLV